ncbi:hypothetical protein BCR37DRAFT_385758 [Protomyces lactucae-debilis]|uniref:Uncharacterized protein n=1 Tax=Protomyces lactucae-debilis TaxID=2754530 RepID=A0A1Y2FQT7_PROLT|nr:uncharacterized protein BCR37DRAFT_385758 [Protomyces lactucae-debilis]ORY86299.1 hypothetical protein BCR37DRAFT_385758 [Protomyces lactucae-debilis]
MEGPLGINLNEARILEHAHQRNHQQSDDKAEEKAPEYLASRRFTDLWGLELPYYFITMAALTLPLYTWSLKWFISGTPFLIFVLLLGQPDGLFKRPPVLSIIILSIQASYLICSTSWLLIKLYKGVCYPAIVIAAFMRITWLQLKLRESLRKVFASFHIHGDKLAFFNFPALDIDDGDVPCLLVIKGVTFSLRTLTLQVHGVEVGVKINDDLEIGIQTDSFIWRIGRNIDIGDIYGTVKGPFTDKKKSGLHRDLEQDDQQAHHDITKGRPPMPMGRTSAAALAEELKAKEHYQATLNKIDRKDITHQARRALGSTTDDENQMRALIGSYIHGSESVPNPPGKSVKSSVLTAMVPRVFKTAFHNIPVLLRLFLNLVAYNHPVLFKSITLTGKGHYINHMLENKLFKHYTQENKELEKLKKFVEGFLSDGNFSLVLDGLLGLASVPLNTEYDIVTFVKTPRILVIKSMPAAHTDDEIVVDHDEDQEQAQTVSIISGAAATFSIPSFLLPDHEHLLPEPPTDATTKDEAQIKMSVLASLPVEFDDAMINFALALIKSSQVLTLHKKANSMSQEVHSIGDFFGSLIGSTSEQIKKSLVEAHVDDAWVEKIFLKAINGLRTLKGDLGYQTDIPIDLSELRSAKRYVYRST